MVPKIQKRSLVDLERIYTLRIGGAKRRLFLIPKVRAALRAALTFGIYLRM